MKRAGHRIWQPRSARSRSGSRPGGVLLIEVPAGISLPAADSALRLFFSSEIEKLANESGALCNRRRICVARVRISRGGDKIILSWQVISVSDYVLRELRELAGEERDGAIDAIADILEEPLWKLLADIWNTSDPGDFGALAEAVSALQATLKSYLIGDPAKLAGSALGLADLSLLEAIAERVPIPGIDKSLGDIRHYAEIAGIMLVVLTGGHILACAPFKLLVHDKLGQLLAKLIDTFLRELGAKPAGRSSPAEPGDRRPWPPDGPAQPPAGPAPNTPPGPDGPDQSPPGSGPPSPPSSGSAGRNYPPAGPGQVRPESPAQPAPDVSP